MGWCAVLRPAYVPARASRKASDNLAIFFFFKKKEAGVSDPPSFLYALRRTVSHSEWWKYYMFVSY